MATKRALKKKAKKFNASTEIRAIARERVGTVRPGRVIVPKADRKPKHKIDPLTDMPR